MFIAIANQADVLTDNREVFHYSSVITTIKVFGNYSLRKETNKLVLIPFDFTRDNNNTENKIDISYPLPVSKYSSGCIAFGHFFRGIASPLLRALPDNNNLYKTVLPLRRAFYYLAGVSGPITEEWIVCENECINWHQEIDIDPLQHSVKHMDLYVSLLRNPEEAVRYFFPKEFSNTYPDLTTTTTINAKLIKERWRDHVFSVRNVVYEICSAASRFVNKSTTTTTLLEYWLQYESNITSKTTTQYVSPNKVSRNFDNNINSNERKNNRRTPNSTNKVNNINNDSRPTRRKPRAIIKYKQPTNDSSAYENEI